jgi:dTDP-4-amino-4,6-dideoxygalactose transaminase
LSIPQIDLHAGYLAHKAEIDGALHRVLDSGWYILGEEVAAFEAEFAAYVGVAHGIGVANGTDALSLALRACNVGPGDVVFTVSHTAVATVAAIESIGALAVLVDIDPVTYTLDPNALEAAIQGWQGYALKAVVPVHLYGHPAPLPAILEIARRYNLLVIEDCAQAHGARLHGRPVGAWGDLAAFSFYPTKNLGALGDGGMVVSNDPTLAERVRSLRQYGWQQRYISDIPGVNSRLDEVHAAILRVKLPYLDEDNLSRRQVAQIYTQVLAGTLVATPATKPQVEHVYHQYVVRTPPRDQLQAYLRHNGIGVGIHYPVPVHLQPAYRKRPGKTEPLEQTEQAAQEILSLPIFPQLSAEKVVHIAETIRAWQASEFSIHGVRYGE